MIVKVQNADGWTYFGDVIRVNTYLVEDMPELEVKTDAGDAPRMIHSTPYADMQMRDGEQATAIIEAGAYLLDDSGNTIEKL